MEDGIDPRNKPLVLASLKPVVPLLTTAGEHATERARAYFKEQPLEAARVRDRYLFAHLVRHQVCSYLNDRGQAARIDTRWLPNSGVAFSLDWMDVRFLKSYFGKLPAPGYSRVKQAFYSQTIERGLWDVADPSFQRVNIVVTWDVDASGALSALTVYSPSGGGTASNSARSYWQETLVHPAVSYEPAPEEEEPADEEREDLDIERRAAESDEQDQQGQAGDA